MTQNTLLSTLDHARTKYSQAELAKILGVSTKTVSRWETGGRPLSRIQDLALQQILSRPRRELLPKADFRFIDLFAGIGGTRLGIESIGGECVWTSEWDSHSQKSYANNFADDHAVAGDIREVDARDIPDFDFLVGGFPCQPFSICLLYTSPSPRDQRGSRMPSSA